MRTPTIDILIIDSSDWDREHIRQNVRALSKPVRVVDERDVESGAVRPDVIILGFSDATSLETSRSRLEQARSASPHAQLIVCAPRGTDDLDSRILQLKARAFVLKPVDGSTFRTLLEETFAAIELRKEREEYARSSKKTSRIDEVVGSSEQIRTVLSLLEKVAESPSTSVLLLGETGVGKSLFARTVHELCPHVHGPFIEINCATLPPQLLESELFGYEPGAFTDARSRKIGLIEIAHQGTLFLDEITEIDLVTQAKLLKFLDSKHLRRLGGGEDIAVEVRVVAASNRNIRTEVREGNFREDLFYRLNVVEIEVPPLRERPEDIDSIAAYYLDHYRAKFGKPNLALSEEAAAVVRDYHWPGNVRELINVIERAALLCSGDEIGPAHLPIETNHKEARVELDATERVIDLALPGDGVKLAAVERALIEETLRLARGNVSRAAQMLGLSRGALRNRLARYRIDPHRFHGPRATKVLV